MSLSSFFVLLVVTVYIAVYLVDSSFNWFALFILSCCLYSTDWLLLVYLLLELTLIPVFVLFTLDLKKYRVSRYILSYTLFGSLVFFLPIVWLLYQGVFDLSSMSYIDTGSFVPFALFVSLMFKMPLYGLHSWLTQAHAEANTTGSVCLAALVLKLTAYLYIRLYLEASYSSYSSYVLSDSIVCFVYIVLPLIGCTLAALCAIRATDLKRLIAYSSVSHVNLFVLASAFGYSEGLLVFNLGHAYCSALMFLSASYVYAVSGNRTLAALYSSYNSSPLAGLFMHLGVIGSLAFPCTAAFVAETLLYSQLVQSSNLLGLLTVGYYLFNATYLFTLYAKVIGGSRYLPSSPLVPSCTLASFVCLGYPFLVTGLFPLTLAFEICT